MKMHLVEFNLKQWVRWLRENASALENERRGTLGFNAGVVAELIEPALADKRRLREEIEKLKEKNGSCA